MNGLAEVPRATLTVDPTADQDARHLQITAVCQALLPAWRQLKHEEINVSTISGGISNALYKVTPSTSTALNPVAFRIYGANTEKFIDREKEVAAMAALHAHGFGPALLGFFPNGRIESFLPMRCLNPDEMAAATFVPGIAATLAKFHAFNAAEAPATPATPFGRIYEWLDVVSGLDFSDNAAKAEAFAAFDLKQMREEVVAVEKAAAMAQSPVVFAHNDLLSGNIMVALSNTPQNGNNGARNPAEGDESAVAAPSGAAQAPDCSREAEDGACAADMTFIDFEYADWAPRGFDWGNHFCEYAGFECDYTRYPGPEAAGRFVRAYLAAAGGVTPDNVSDAAVQRGVAEANVFSLASHMYWGTWALMQARWSSIDFDYMGYAALRWGEYRRRRDEFLSQAASVFASSA